jgi:hypothetical protein
MELDTTVWVTQKTLADEIGASIQAVHNWVNRNRIKWMYLPGSTKILVDKTTISVRKYNKQKSK